MAKFITGNQLNTEVEKIFEQASSLIILISPYIKLHDRFASTLREKKGDPNIEMTVVFGKNEDDYSRSMSQADFNFFKEFPNIEIRYEKRLHAKYYANELSAIITSMNLYSYSQDNNIEAGVLTEWKVLTSDGVSNEADEYFNRVISQSELLYKKVPKFESKFMGITKKYIQSVVKTDKLSDFFAGTIKQEEISYNRNSYKKPEIEVAKRSDSTNLGYCIRTGKQIPFNPTHPMCDDAYKSWKNFSNKDYAEKYCHFSGELSNGETSYGRPILRKNWQKAKQDHNL